MADYKPDLYPKVGGFFPGGESMDRAWGEEESVVARLGLHLLMVMRFNTHAITEAVLESPGRPVLLDLHSLGMGLYPSLCLVNASCDQVLRPASKFMSPECCSLQ
jgi:hypothetical protein